MKWCSRCGQRTKRFGALLGLILLVCFVNVLLTGCARHYVVTLNNGTRISTRGKPKLQQGAYVFKDISGEPTRVPAGSVREIAPSSMVTREGQQFLPSSSK